MKYTDIDSWYMADVIRPAADTMLSPAEVVNEIVAVISKVYSTPNADDLFERDIDGQRHEMRTVEYNGMPNSAIKMLKQFGFAVDTDVPMLPTEKITMASIMDAGIELRKITASMKVLFIRIWEVREVLVFRMDYIYRTNYDRER